ncbi:MAG: CHAT domain-containing protein [Armatimonadota bacterium]
MDRTSYLDFDLFIQPAAEGYRLRVDSSAGQAAASFALPFSDLEVENFLLRVGRPRRATRRIDSPEGKAAKDFGARLFDSVFDGEVRGLLRSSLEEARRQGGGLRIRLRLTEVPELSDLPWEYLYNPALNRFLGLDVETPLIRFLDLPERVEPFLVTPPLRILAMISNPVNYPELDVEREWARLREALADLEQRGLVALERLPAATLALLQRQLRRGEYNILHFIGHGGFDSHIQDGVLVLEDDGRRGRPVSGQDLGMMIHGHRPMRMAVLNACEGGRPSRTDPFAGVAQSLVQQGLAAVVAMQFEITDDAAIAFAHEFYAALADGYPVDAALVEARKAIFAQDNGLEWGTPVLYLRASDGRIFDVQKARDQRSIGMGQEPSATKPTGDVDESRTPPVDSAIEHSPEDLTAPAAPRRTRWAIAAGLAVVMVVALVIALRPSVKGDEYLIAPGKGVGRWRLGQEVAVYALGTPSDRWDGLVENGPNKGKHYYNGYAYSVTPTRPALNVHECLKDRKVFAVYVLRKVDTPVEGQLESVKYRTQEAIGIGSSEQELVAKYGRPGSDSVSQWPDMHGDTRVTVLNYSYPGFDVLLNVADRRIFGIAATTLDAWEACEKAAFGS